MNFAGEAYLDDKSIGRHGGRPSKGNAKNSELEGRAPSRPLRLDDNPSDNTEVVPPKEMQRAASWRDGLRPRPLRLDDNPLDDTEVVPPREKKRGRVSPAAFSISNRD